jgi:hypothetical protein
MPGADAEKGAEGGMPGAAAVEAEHELIEIGLKVLAAQAVIDAKRPHLEVGEDAVHPRQDDMGGHLADDVGIVSHTWGRRRNWATHRSWRWPRGRDRRRGRHAGWRPSNRISV